MSNAIVSMAGKLANKFDMAEGGELLDALKATAFRGQVSDAQMMALLAVSNQYGLKPWTKEIYAFPDKTTALFRLLASMAGRGSSTDMRSLTASSSINPLMPAPAASTAKIAATRPWSLNTWTSASVTLAMAIAPAPHVAPQGDDPAARIAFGYVGIFDQDEAERIVERTWVPRRSSRPRRQYRARSP